MQRAVEPRDLATVDPLFRLTERGHAETTDLDVHYVSWRTRVNRKHVDLVVADPDVSGDDAPAESDYVICCNLLRDRTPPLTKGRRHADTLGIAAYRALIDQLRGDGYRIERRR